MNISKNISKYCTDLFNYKRRKSSEIYIGDVPMGADNPIRTQSMTTTNTLDVDATVEQVIRVIKSGACYVRITAQGVKEAESLKSIKDELLKRGYSTPLVADIHFNPKAAEVAACYVDKVRINPGNFADKRAVFKDVNYSDEEYEQELEKIKDKFIPLLNICKKYGTALRIGTNHGSLSDRIMSRYGDTPQGMVESTMEFLRICKSERFNDVAVSIKASNTVIMVKTVRLLAQEMNNENMFFPLHLGVTEAGEGEDGRIKSVVGIGALLNDGIGDTIRISLTESPEVESPVAQRLIDYVRAKENHSPIRRVNDLDISPIDFYKRPTLQVDFIGSDKVPVVITDLSSEKKVTTDLPEKAGYQLDVKAAIWKKGKLPSDFIYINGCDSAIADYPKDLGIIVSQEYWDFANKHNANSYPLFSANEFKINDLDRFKASIFFVICELVDLDEAFLKRVKSNEKVVLVAETNHENGFAEQRAFFYKLIKAECNVPVIIKRSFKESLLEDLQIKSACDIGGLFIDGFGNGIWLDNGSFLSDNDVNATAFGILQAARVRTSKTEFISCPGCGRTLFSLNDTALLLKQKLAHLTHLKIGIMGCIVNGPGEMGDVDYGYVGSTYGKITLYKGHNVIRKDIPTDKALDELINLIKENGDWKDS